MSDPERASGHVSDDKSNAYTLQPCPERVSDPQQHKQKHFVLVLSL
jgi:hypothetical protein